MDRDFDASLDAMNRLRVLHLVVAGDIGGAERLLVDLATHPEATGAEHEIALVTPNRALAEFFATAGLRVHDRGPARDSPIAYLWRSLGPADVAWLMDVVAGARPDVMHTHTFASHVLGTRAARRTRTPQLRTEHHVMHYFDASTSAFTRWAARRTDRFVAISEYVARVLAETAPYVSARASVVRNGVDVAHWRPAPPAGEPSERGGFRVAVVCRLTAWKRVHLAIEAVAIAGVDLVVVGDGEERASLEALARDKRAPVTFAGYARDPRPLVAACDATVSTARDEPLGLSVLESLAMERPVVAVAGGGIPEILRDGETGFLVRDATAAALADALVRARSERQSGRLREMGNAGRRFVVEQCSVERMCEGYAAAYRTTARGA